MEIYLVGGAVRDRLLGWPVTEKDWLVTGATPEQMLALGYQPVGRDFPVFLHPETREEYALARTERKVSLGYQGFAFFTSPDVTVEEDLRRRDITINAMAQQPGHPLIDPFGGLQDLKARRLRHVSEAFVEDPLRVLRVARFAARYHHLGFFVAPETLQLMKEISESGELSALSGERIWKEVSRGLMERAPQIFIEVLLACGALQQILPEVAALRGVPQPEKHHPEIDTFAHLMLCLKQAADNQLVLCERYALLCHDLGKGTTPQQEWPQHIAHEHRGIAMAQGISQRLKVPARCEELARKMSEFHTHCHRALELRANTLHTLFTKLDGSRKPDMVESFIRCCECDARGRATLENRDYPQADYLRRAYQAWQHLDVPSLTAQGYQGAALGSAIERQRISQLEAFRKQCQHLSP